MAQLRVRVWERLDDDGTYYTGAEVLHALNVGQRLFALLTLCVERTSSFDIISGQTFYNVTDQLPDYLVPLRIYHISGLRLQPDTIHNLDMRNAGWRATPGAPRRYAQHGFKLLAITPQPTTDQNLRITYAAEPTELVLDTDTPDIPPEQHIHLVDFAFWFLRLKEGGKELANAVPMLQRFLTQAQKYSSFERSKSKGQRYDTLPMDLTTFDRSRFDLKLRPEPQSTRKGKASSGSPT